jgi:hypothetical protein
MSNGVSCRLGYTCHRLSIFWLRAPFKENMVETGSLASSNIVEPVNDKQLGEPGLSRNTGETDVIECQTIRTLFQHEPPRSPPFALGYRGGREWVYLEERVGHVGRVVVVQLCDRGRVGRGWVD